MRPLSFNSTLVFTQTSSSFTLHTLTYSDTCIQHFTFRMSGEGSRQVCFCSASGGSRTPGVLGPTPLPLVAGSLGLLPFGRGSPASSSGIALMLSSGCVVSGRQRSWGLGFLSLSWSISGSRGRCCIFSPSLPSAFHDTRTHTGMHTHTQATEQEYVFVVCCILLFQLMFVLCSFLCVFLYFVTDAAII